MGPAQEAGQIKKRPRFWRRVDGEGGTSAKLLGVKLVEFAAEPLEELLAPSTVVLSRVGRSSGGVGVVHKIRSSGSCGRDEGMGAIASSGSEMIL